jgi:hypothetical protein
LIRPPRLECRGSVAAILSAAVAMDILVYLIPTPPLSLIPTSTEVCDFGSPACGLRSLQCAAAGGRVVYQVALIRTEWQHVLSCSSPGAS